MKPLCDLCVIVPSNNMQIIEDLHLAIAHSILGLYTPECRVARWRHLARDRPETKCPEGQGEGPLNITFQSRPNLLR